MFFQQRISARTMLARTLWQQGFADQARDCAQEGLALARSIDHALSLCFVLAHALVPVALRHNRDDATASLALAGARLFHLA